MTTETYIGCQQKKHVGKHHRGAAAVADPELDVREVREHRVTTTCYLGRPPAEPRKAISAVRRSSSMTPAAGAASMEMDRRQAS